MPYFELGPSISHNFPGITFQMWFQNLEQYLSLLTQIIEEQSKKHNSQIRISIYLAEKISSNWIHGTYQSVQDKICIDIEILCVWWDTKDSPPVVCWLLLKCFCAGGEARNMSKKLMPHEMKI